MKREKGFTLIELMVVIVIIGILASVALPKFMVNQRKAKEGAAWADLDSMTTACEMYFLDMDEYPIGTGSLDTAGAGLTDLVVDPSISGKTWGGAYMKYRKATANVPEDPWGNEYAYEAAASSPSTYTVWSMGGPYTGNESDYSAVYINTGLFKSP